MHQISCPRKLFTLKNICVVLFIFISIKEINSATIKREKTLPDACSDVHLPPNAPRNTYKELQVMNGSNSKGEPVERMCCACNPGFYLDQICSPDNRTSTICLPCPPGTYITDYAHIKRECTKEVRNCPPGMVWIPSQPHKAPRCDCPKGYHLSDDNETCKPHTLCGPGYGVKVYPSHIRDTECEKCAHGYDSQSESYKDTCKLVKRPTQPQTRSIARTTFITKIISSNNYTTPPSSTTTTTTTTTTEALTNSTVFKEQHETNLPTVIGVLSAFAVVTVVIALILWWKRYRHSRKRDTNTGNVDEERPLTTSSGVLYQNREVGAHNEANASPSSRRDEVNTNQSTTNDVSIRVIDAATNGNANRQLLSTNNTAEETSTSDSETSNNMREKLEKLWNEIKVSILLDDLYQFYRHFAAQFPNRSVDQLLEQLRNSNDSTIEKASIVFSKLSQLSEDKFNPRLIAEYFDNLGYMVYSEIAKKYI